MRKISPRLLTPLPALLLLLSTWSCAGQPPRLGLVDGHLRPCPDTPNCLNSEEAGRSHIEPLYYNSLAGVALQNLKQTVVETEGKIVDDGPGYLRAVYTSQLMRFEDDVEFRLDDAAKTIQLRSASRSGFWDLGVNRRRLELVRRLFSGRDARSGRQ